MLKPSINEVTEKVDNRYYLISMISKRSRDLVNGANPMVETEPTEKPVHIATREVVEDKITFRLLTEDEIHEKERIHDIEQKKKLLEQE